MATTFPVVRSSVEGLLKRSRVHRLPTDVLLTYPTPTDHSISPKSPSSSMQRQFPCSCSLTRNQSAPPRPHQVRLHTPQRAAHTRRNALSAATQWTSEPQLFHTVVVPASWRGRRGACLNTRVRPEFKREEGAIWVGSTWMYAPVRLMMSFCRTGLSLPPAMTPAQTKKLIEHRDERFTCAVNEWVHRFESRRFVRNVSAGFLLRRLKVKILSHFFKVLPGNTSLSILNPKNIQNLYRPVKS